MHYTTKVIQIAGEECHHHHLFVVEKQTICGIKLSNRQTILKYNLDELKLCSECKKINPIPRIRDWCPRYRIENGEQAKTALTILHLFYFNFLTEELQIGWGVWEYGNYGYCIITNFLVNPDPKIEEVMEEERLLDISIVGGEGRINEELPFELIEEFMPLIREDFLLEHLRKRTN